MLLEVKCGLTEKVSLHFFCVKIKKRRTGVDKNYSTNTWDDKMVEKRYISWYTGNSIEGIESHKCESVCDFFCVYRESGV